MMDYSLGKSSYKNWILAETTFSSKQLGKTESVMVLGNGYLGLRSASEEPYLQERRTLLINGTFNKAADNEVTELPNAADVTRLDIRVDGERFSLEIGETKNYIKQLNLKDAELSRSFEWTSPDGKKLLFRFRRFVSFVDQHLIGMKLEIENMGEAVDIAIDSGINAQMTNTGVQHFLEGEQRILEDRFIQLVQQTTESGIDVVHNAVHKLKLNGVETSLVAEKNMDRRKVWMTYQIRLESNDCLDLEKLAIVNTSRDLESENQPYSLENMRTQSLENLKNLSEQGYQDLFQFHRLAWQKQIWDVYDFEVESEDPADQLALRFSLYHLTAMTPAHDDRMGIGAKALSGEGYKGHSFWDTEIFILPFFIYSNPAVAKSLLTYRFNGLAGAREKAADNGYAGAMYPWEMAWPTDGEVTPEWGGVDVVTGEQTKIWPGFIEQHISADIAFAVYQYGNVTGDKEFLERCGHEMVFETAKFWASRLEWVETEREFHITNVIGPDEYKEHVSNNAFTNYMAYFNLKLAMRYADELTQQNPERRKAFRLDKDYADWQIKSEKIYLPEPRQQDSVIPQDDTYLQLKGIDLSKYKKQVKVGTIYRDYNSEQINGIQVSKQADTILLFYLLDQTFLRDDYRFSDQSKRANFFYYEARTLHDSSLSLATHAIVANDLGESELAYSLFKKSCNIDMGPGMGTSDAGIHAAAIGGIWKSAVFGFAGVRLTDGRLQINPRLPKQWQKMRFSIFWQGQPLSLEITQDVLMVTVLGDRELAVETDGISYQITGTKEIALGSNQSHTPR